MDGDSITKADLKLRKDAKLANLAFLEALRSEGPPDLVWHEPFLGNQFIKGSPLSETARRQQASLAHSMAEKEAVRARTVKRDPCPHCGIRQDIGCRHLPRSIAGLTPDHVNAVWDATVNEAWNAPPKAEAA